MMTLTDDFKIFIKKLNYLGDVPKYGIQQSLGRDFTNERLYYKKYLSRVIFWAFYKE